MGYTPPHLEVRKVTGGWSISPPGSTTDDLFIYPNRSDLYPVIELIGTLAAPGSINLRTAPVRFYYDTTQYLSITTNVYPRIAPPVDIDLGLEATGTGRVRFGTYTAGAATDSTGYIEIKDDGGTTRKLMVQA